MQITIVTIFPEVFTYLDSSIIRKARDKGIIRIDFVNPRDFTTDKHRSVDDIPYGGGAGMIFKPEPFYRALFHIRQNSEDAGEVIMATPQGTPFNQNMAHQLAKKKHLIFFSGHYEGFDDRIRRVTDMEISIGDYVLTGGELPVQVIIDAVARLIPGVIMEESAARESFHNSLLDYPQYTRPPVFEGMTVPGILLSGHHEKIEAWRKKEAIRRTLVRRPDLMEKAFLSEDEKKAMEEVFMEELERDKGDGKSDIIAM